MRFLSFKNYPPVILAVVICIIVSINYGIHAFYLQFSAHKILNTRETIVLIATNSGLVITLLTLANRFVVNKWSLLLLKLPYLKGNYTGSITTSFYIDNNSELGHVQRYCRMKINQDLNGIEINNEFYTDEAFSDFSSSSISRFETVEKINSGDFVIRYWFANKGNLIHPDNERYGLTSHDGVCELIFNPESKELKGFYFTHERGSKGRMLLRKVQ